ncbi:hypothetical protein C4566_00430, partial [Candidatus Parcubacteria bacterium]
RAPDLAVLGQADIRCHGPVEAFAVAHDVEPQEALDRLGLPEQLILLVLDGLVPSVIIRAQRRADFRVLLGQVPDLLDQLDAQAEESDRLVTGRADDDLVVLELGVGPLDLLHVDRSGLFLQLGQDVHCGSSLRGLGLETEDTSYGETTDYLDQIVLILADIIA